MLTEAPAVGDCVWIKVMSDMVWVYGGNTAEWYPGSLQGKKLYSSVGFFSPYNSVLENDIQGWF